MNYLVVDPADFTESPPPVEDWTIVDASCVERAAEVFCERSDRENHNEYLEAEGGTVMVRDDAGKVYSVSVSARVEHFYNARKKHLVGQFEPVGGQ